MIGGNPEHLTKFLCVQNLRHLSFLAISVPLRTSFQSSIFTKGIIALDVPKVNDYLKIHNDECSKDLIGPISKTR